MLLDNGTGLSTKNSEAYAHSSKSHVSLQVDHRDPIWSMCCETIRVLGYISETISGYSFEIKDKMETMVGNCRKLP